MIIKIISGFQTGGDIAGIKTAKRFGIEVGGTMTRGYRTSDGPRPEYADLYNAKEHESFEYPGRTEQNVLDSDGTIALAYNFGSAGERLTKRLCTKHKKPHFPVDLIIRNKQEFFGQCDEVIKWLNHFNIQVLNVAGNSKNTNYHTEAKATMFLEELFRRLGLEEK